MKNLNFIETDISGDTGIIWLNRPDKGNAINLGLIREFVGIIQEWEVIEEIRFVVIKGRGKHFCSGADLTWMAASSLLTEEQNMNESMELAGLFECIFYSRMICIAQVHGACYGGGIGLASVCDFVYADESAKFSFGETKLGLVPATIAPFVSNRIGTTKAKQLMLTGKSINVNRAYEIGLLDEILWEKKQSEGVNEIIKELRENSLQAQRDIKRLLNSLTNEHYSEDLKVKTSKIIARSRISAHGKEGIRAFLEKRPPNWTKE